MPSNLRETETDLFNRLRMSASAFCVRFSSLYLGPEGHSFPNKRKPTEPCQRTGAGGWVDRTSGEVYFGSLVYTYMVPEEEHGSHEAHLVIELWPALQSDGLLSWKFQPLWSFNPLTKGLPRRLRRPPGGCRDWHIFPTKELRLCGMRLKYVRCFYASCVHAHSALLNSILDAHQRWCAASAWPGRCETDVKPLNILRQNP